MSRAKPIPPSATGEGATGEGATSEGVTGGGATAPPSGTSPSGSASPGSFGSDSSAELVRRLLRTADRGVLSTRSARADGWPYGSLVMIAVDHDLSPILLLSDLAEHTHNLAADPRASLLVDATAGHEDPLAAPRVTLMGRVARIDRAAAARYGAHHPGSALHAGFADFHHYRLVIERAHLVAGFGRIRWLEAGQIAPPVPEALARDERKLLDALNGDGALIRRLAAAAGAAGPEGWKVVGLDRDGIDLRWRDRMLRLWFEQAADTAEAALAAIEPILRAHPAKGPPP